jgi:hypothetical protein
VTDDLRARIVAALEECRVLIPEAQADAVMAVIEPDLEARGAAVRALMVAAEQLALDWPNPGTPAHRQAVTRAINAVEASQSALPDGHPRTRWLHAVEDDEQPTCACGAPAVFAVGYCGETASVLQCVRCATADPRTPFFHRPLTDAPWLP